MIAAEAVLGERSFDLVGEPQWIVAVIFDLGHCVVPDAQWSFDRCRPRALVRLVTSRRRRGSALIHQRNRFLDGTASGLIPPATSRGAPLTFAAARVAGVRRAAGCR